MGHVIKKNNTKSKKKHLISKSHEYLSMSLVYKISVKNPELNKIKELLKKHINDYGKKFEFFHKNSEWKIHFKNEITTKVELIGMKHKQIYCGDGGL